MPKFEIERKYKVKSESYKDIATNHTKIIQGYLSRNPEATVRVRIKGNAAMLTVKGITNGCVREEYEYEIPAEDAREMMKMCQGMVIEKTRWIVEYKGYVWEVDEFKGALAGLTLAEVELPSADIIPELPEFVGEDVTGNPKYFNSNLGASDR